MKRVIFIMSIAVFALFMNACKTKKEAQEGKDAGPLSENYTLKKADMTLVEKYWKLIELYGQPVITGENNKKEPYIIFRIDGNRFNGNASCNEFSGSFQTKDPNRIALSQIASTRMMCLNMDTEDKFLQVLNTVDSYFVQNDTLVLNRARMAPLARFVAVYLK